MLATTGWVQISTPNVNRCATKGVEVGIVGVKFILLEDSY